MLSIDEKIRKLAEQVVSQEKTIEELQTVCVDLYNQIVNNDPNTISPKQIRTLREDKPDDRLKEIQAISRGEL
jgi:hypothetical protein